MFCKRSCSHCRKFEPKVAVLSAKAVTKYSVDPVLCIANVSVVGRGEHQDIELRLSIGSVAFILSKSIFFSPFRSLPLPELWLHLVNCLTNQMPILDYLYTKMTSNIHRVAAKFHIVCCSSRQNLSVTLNRQVVTENIASASPNITVTLQFQQLRSTILRKYLTVQKSKLNSRETGTWTAENPLPTVLRERCQNIRKGMEGILNGIPSAAETRTTPKGFFTIPERI